MDQVKIGRFIQTMRKEQSLTQRQLADKLNISDKTVSKWETGKGMPEISLMLSLCELLRINVNELLSGEKITQADYQKKAEENMMNLIKEKEESKKKIILSVIIMLITVVSVVLLILLAGLLDMSLALRICIITAAIIIMVLGTGAACVLDREAGVFECRKCKARFVPTMKAYIMGPHTLTTRYLKCPECGESSYCKRRLSK